MLQIAKTLAAQKMCARLENWEELADDVESAALAAASSQEDADISEHATNESTVRIWILD